MSVKNKYAYTTVTHHTGFNPDRKLPKNKDRPYFVLFAFIFGVVVGLNIGVFL